MFGDDVLAFLEWGEYDTQSDVIVNGYIGVADRLRKHNL